MLVCKRHIRRKVSTAVFQNFWNYQKKCSPVEFIFSWENESNASFHFPDISEASKPQLKDLNRLTETMIYCTGMLRELLQCK